MTNDTLGEIAAEFDQADESRAQPREISATARNHRQQRWQAGYDLEAVVREYCMLRHAILLVAAETGEAVDIH